MPWRSREVPFRSAPWRHSGMPMRLQVLSAVFTPACDKMQQSLAPAKRRKRQSACAVMRQLVRRAQTKVARRGVASRAGARIEPGELWASAGGGRRRRPRIVRTVLGGDARPHRLRRLLARRSGGAPGGGAQKNGGKKGKPGGHSEEYARRPVPDPLERTEPNLNQDFHSGT